MPASIFKEDIFNEKPTAVSKIITERVKADGSKQYAAKVIIDMGTSFFGLFRNRTTYYLHYSWGNYSINTWSEYYAWLDSKYEALQWLDKAIEYKIKELLRKKVVSVRVFKVPN